MSDAITFQATINLSADAPELAMTLAASASAPLKTKLGYPQPFMTGEDTSLIVPLNEGIQYPVSDTSVRPLGPLVTYGGHGICMPWWGVTTQKGEGPGVQAILSTPDDADIEIQRTAASGDRLFIRPFWEAQKGTFGYARKITYVFTDRGGYVAQAKRYRRWSQQNGLFKSLADKRRENPNVDKLIGAANIWNWDPDKIALCKEMKSLGMDRILWSSGGTPDELKAINALGYLTGRYDIYQDVWSPDAPKGLKTEGWPDDLVLLPDGSWMKGWAHIVKHPDGTQTVYPGGVISSSRGLARAKREIPADLETHPYLCRFIDTTTAAPFREDYSPVHPLTRSQDRHYKMALLEFCSKDEKLVTGSETGLDAAVPYVDYFEGMLSLGPYRLPDAGRDMIQYKPPTPDFLKYQVGPVYRIPLWELVYHDCVVADWYWGDYNNKAPEVWDQRDLFNVLYGTPPLLMFTKATWEKDKARFIQSYRTICPVVRRLGYDEMLSHAFLTPDHTVQRTHWRSGATITVNLGKTPYTDGKDTIAPMGWKITPG